MGEVSQQCEDEAMPDTASPCETELVSDSKQQKGWGRLLPINCSLQAQDLTEGIYTIGRERRRCNLSITKFDVEPEVFKQISKIHCRISRTKMEDDEYVVFLEDLSSNGTYVNEQKIGRNEKTIISNDDEISFALPQNKVFLFIDAAKGSYWMPPILASKYHIIKHLGTGGFAEVKLVLDKRTCEKLAVKKLSKAGIEEKRILNEIKILKDLAHPCIVQMKYLIETKDSAFVFMEYVPNGNLLEKLRIDKKLPEPLAKFIFFQLTWAVDYMHSQGITHRDLKPENILLTIRNDRHVTVKVADFGLAKVIDSMTNLKTACGTLCYTAPEVLSSRGQQNYTNKVDMWGLGVVLFLCLCGRRPFISLPNQNHSLIENILKGQYSISTPEWAHISMSAKLLVRRLLHLRPSHRIDCREVFRCSWLKDTSLVEDIQVVFGKGTTPIDDEVNAEPPQKILKMDEESMSY